MNGWDNIARSAERPTACLRAALTEPREAQLRLLQHLLSENADTEFGRQHGFGRIRSFEDFQRAVPIRSYEGLRPWIDRAAAGEACVLTAEPVIAFERTGGSTSGGKLVPYTESLLRGFRAAVLPWLGNLLRQRPAIGRGRAFISVSPQTRQPEKTIGGFPIGLPSEGAYLGAELAQSFAAVLVNAAVPPTCTMEEWQIATLRSLVMAEDLTFISVWSPTFLTRLLEDLAALASSVLDGLSGEPRAAARLREALAGGGLRTSILWPNLDTISCWTDGASGVFARNLAERFPGVFIEPKGLLATESAITLPFGFENGNIPALTSAFLEFISPSGEARLVDQVDLGREYRIAITTPGGLYRYDIGDRVRCVGHEGAVPLLRFVGRAGLVSDMVGEKLTEDFVAQALSDLPCAAMLVARLEPQPFYELWLDGAPHVDADGIDMRLCANPQYAYARSLRQLGTVRLKPVPGFVRALQDAHVRRGRRLGDLKMQALLPPEAERFALDQLAGWPSAG